MLLAFLISFWMTATDPSVLTVPVVHAEEIDYSTTTLRIYAKKMAIEHNLNVTHFIKTIQCESNFKYDALGDMGTSIGIAQFRYPERWGLSTTTAYDPYISIDKMAQAWDDGLEWHWSCYNKLYGSKGLE